jgi:hypothetical protein
MAFPETYINQSECASDIGWPPGSWPLMATHYGVQYFFYRKEVDQEGDLVAVVYRSARAHRQLTVFND